MSGRSLALALALALGAGGALAQEGAAPPPASGMPAEAEHAEEHYHGLDTSALAVQALGFTILAIVLGYFAGPFVANALGARRERIKGAQDGIAAERQAVAERRKAVETQLAQAEKTSLERMEEARREGARLREALVAEGDAAAAKIRQKAKLEAAIERAKMILSLRNEVVDTGFRAAEAVIRETIDRETEDRLIASFLDELEQVRRA